MMPPEGRAMLVALGMVIVAIPTILLLGAAIVLLPGVFGWVYLTAGVFGLAFLAAVIEA